MFMNKFIFLGILGACMFNHSVAMSQEINYALSETDLREIVLRFHPIAREGVAMIRQASGEKLAARGAFDPRFSTNRLKKRLMG